MCSCQDKDTRQEEDSRQKHLPLWERKNGWEYSRTSMPWNLQAWAFRLSLDSLNFPLRRQSRVRAESALGAAFLLASRNLIRSCLSHCKHKIIVCKHRWLPLKTGRGGLAHVSDFSYITQACLVMQTLRWASLILSTNGEKIIKQS